MVGFLSLGSKAYADETKITNKGIDIQRLPSSSSARSIPGETRQGVDKARYQKLNQNQEDVSIEGFDIARQLSPTTRHIRYSVSGNNLILSFSPDLVLQTSTSLGPDNWLNVAKTEKSGQHIVSLNEAAGSPVGFFRLVDPK